MRTFERYKTLIDILYKESLSDFIDKDDFYERIRCISKDFDRDIKNIDNRFYNDHFKRSSLFRLFKVHERVKLVRHLERMLYEPGDFIEKHMFPGLNTYLLLTCFDTLGQNDKGWRTFPDWLNSEKCKHERDQIYSEVNSMFTSHIDGNLTLKYAERIYLRYNEVYGVKNCFMNFLRSLLPKEQRLELFNKIKIEIYAENSAFKYYDDEPAKENWLYSIRNNYTHSAISPEGFTTRGFYDFNENWEVREEIHSKNEVRVVMVRESFKKEVEKSIIIGIRETIINNS